MEDCGAKNPEEGKTIQNCENENIKGIILGPGVSRRLIAR